MRTLEDDEESLSAPRKFPNMTKLIHQNYKCDLHLKHTFRNLYTINILKFQHCEAVYNRISDFEMKDFLAYLPNIATSIMSINETKRSLYCSICDQDQQSNINIVDKKMYFTEEFCLNFLSEYKSYLLWKNIYFIDYLYDLF